MLYMIPQKKNGELFHILQSISSPVAVTKSWGCRGPLCGDDLLPNLCHGRRLAGKQGSSASKSGVILFISISSVEGAEEVCLTEAGGLGVRSAISCLKKTKPNQKKVRGNLLLWLGRWPTAALAEPFSWGLFPGSKGLKSGVGLPTAASGLRRYWTSLFRCSRNLAAAPNLVSALRATLEPCCSSFPSAWETFPQKIAHQKVRAGVILKRLGFDKRSTRHHKGALAAPLRCGPCTFFSTVLQLRC